MFFLAPRFFLLVTRFPKYSQFAAIVISHFSLEYSRERISFQRGSRVQTSLVYFSNWVNNAAQKNKLITILIIE